MHKNMKKLNEYIPDLKVTVIIGSPGTGKTK